MSDIKAVIQVEHPDIVLTRTISHDRSATVMPVSEAGTDPDSGRFLYHVESSDFRRFEDGLQADHTIAEFEQVIETAAEKAIYSFEYTDEAKTFSPVISNANGIAVEMENDDNAWVISLWMPDREKLVDIWDYAQTNNIDIDLRHVTGYASLGKTTAGLTDAQREAVLTALEAGYFEDPRDATLSDVGAELDISEPAASGLLRRGLKRLIVACLVDDSE
jgi:predicted DNA binding protein